MHRTIPSVRSTFAGRGRLRSCGTGAIRGSACRQLGRPLTSCRGFCATVCVLFGWAVHTVSPAAAQTDYYNIDSGRPVRIEDAYPVERYAFEAQVAPLRMERRDDG